jgi:hypothetical protein
LESFEDLGELANEQQIQTELPQLFTHDDNGPPLSPPTNAPINPDDSEQITTNINHILTHTYLNTVALGQLASVTNTTV